jgi:signal transduction histidine kinase
LTTPGSLTRRIVAIALAWIAALLLIGGFALDRVLTGVLTRNFDAQLSYALTAMIAAAEIDPLGEVRLTRPLGDQRFSEPYSGLYWQINARGQAPFASRSLWDRTLPVDMGRNCVAVCASQLGGSEGLRLVERDARLPGGRGVLRFQVAQSSADLEQQTKEVRGVLWWSLGALGAGLGVLAALQAWVGLLPLRRMSRAVADIRAGRATRAPADVPPEVAPLVRELNDLLEHNERAAELARADAGNLAHALKTPMAVLTGEAATQAGPLADAVRREVAAMRRHVEHHLARARSQGRRAVAGARVTVRPVIESVARAVSTVHDQATVDVAGDAAVQAAVERQDLEEIAGNLIDNAATYGGGRVFVTVERDGPRVLVLVEDDGPGVPEAERERVLERGARLDTGRPGTGLGLAIVRDVAAIYGGSVRLGESEDLGGLLVELRLPAVG